MVYQRKKRLRPDEYIDGILSGNRIILSKAITLMESTLPQDNLIAGKVLEAILPYSGNSMRIGITGVPGVGKSTFIDVFGSYITAKNKKIAVLTVDPSSRRSRGAILGDKTRMESLSVDPLAYIRPSASGSSLGGVAGKTRENMLLCEAAGYEIILVETVGVGQSETEVHDMVDFFLLLMLAGAGDELQGMKKGIIEMADSIVITKSDGDNILRAEQAKTEYQNALHLFPPSRWGWYPKVLSCSARNKEGIDKIWELIQEHHNMGLQSGYFRENRRNQNIAWMHAMIHHIIDSRFYYTPEIKNQLKMLESMVAEEKMPVIKAAEALIRLFEKTISGHPHS